MERLEMVRYDHPDTCQVAGCDRPWHAKGMCNMHLRRFRINGTTDRVRHDNHHACNADGCTLPAKRKGYCPKHATRLRRYGDLNAEYRSKQGREKKQHAT